VSTGPAVLRVTEHRGRDQRLRQVVGYWEDSTGADHPFLYSNGTMTSLLEPSYATAQGAAGCSAGGTRSSVRQRRVFGTAVSPEPGRPQSRAASRRATRPVKPRACCVHAC
jgi:probable HAF family extracellular repeat protein